MACPKAGDCPLYGVRDTGWCDDKGTDCVLYDIWHSATLSVAAIEATIARSRAVKQTERRSGG